MRILNITLSNFLCYYGEDNRIDFTDGLNLILGANGYGKSKLYDAFQWVFKDGITDESRAHAVKYTAELNKNLVNERALAEAEIDSKVVCEVCIEATGWAGKTFQLVRRFNVVKTAEDKFKPAPGSQLYVFRKDVIDFKPLSEAEGKEEMAKLIPGDIMPYLWFQGERGVSNLIDTSSRESLKQVINKMSDIQKWDDFIEISAAAYTIADKEFNQALSSDTTQKQKAAAHQAQQAIVQARLNEIDTEISEAEKNYDKASQKQVDIIGGLASAEKINGLKKDRELKIAELRQKTNRIDTLKLGFTKRLFTDTWLLAGTENLVERFLGKYNDYRKVVVERKVAARVATAEAEWEQTRLPEGIPDQFTVNTMLAEEHCLVCDRPALKGTDEHKAIEKLLVKPKVNPVQDTTPNIEEDILAMHRAALKTQGEYSKATIQIATTYAEIDELEEARSYLEEQVDSLSSAITAEVINSGLEESSVSGVLASIQSATRDSNRYAAELQRLGSQRSKFADELKDIENSIGKLSQGGNINPILGKKRKLLKDLSELTKRTRESQYLKFIQQLETTANEHFSRINGPTGAFYGKIKFVQSGTGYVPEIQDDAGNRVDNLNTSQTSSSKLAIIMAIVTANQNRGLASHYPLVADAPISDFDTVKARAFLAEAARTFGQSVVIVKDFLEADPEHIGQYQANLDRLAQVKQDVEASGKKLNVYQLVIPTGQSAQNRKNLSVRITPLTV